MKWNLFWSALLAASVAAPVHAQQLLAWPMGSPNALRQLWPGMPVRPLPHPRPMPRPMPVPQPGPVAPPEATPLTVSGYRVEGHIQDQVANLTFNVSFRNPTDRIMEGVLVFPVPADTVLSGLTMTAGGKEMKGELLDAAQATTIYENIVRQQRDPALLELIGERLVRAKVFPIPARGEVSVKIVVSQLVPKSGELAGLTIPLSSAKMLQAEGGRKSVLLRLNSTAPLRTVYSPTPGALVRRQSPTTAEISYEEGAAPAAGDLSLFYSVRKDPLAPGLLTFKESGEDGYFLLTLSPKPQTDEKAVIPKDIVFVVDRSGSMEEGGKMEQARKALAHCIRRLSLHDRFAIVDFATDSASFEPRLVQATPQNRERALRYVERLEAAGGTNIEAGINDALGLLSKTPGRLPLVFFMTDGLPTAGRTDVQAILSGAADRNAPIGARIFSFGVGADVNTLLLDKLSEAGRGARDYVSPGEDIEAKVSGLYQKVAKPALTDIKLEWRGVAASDLHPKPHDLFYGSELSLFGRFRAGGKGTFIVTGQAAGKPARFEFPIEFPNNAPRHGFLPRLWANAKVAQALDAIRLSGRADPEVVSEIVRLAKRHGIVTPYTSYLVTEEGMDRVRAERSAVSALRGMSMDAAKSGFSGGGGKSAVAQRASKLFGAMASSMAPIQGMISGAANDLGGGGALAVAEQEAKDDLRRSGIAVATTKVVAGKTFYQRGNAWHDGDYELADAAVKAKPVEIEYLSPAYFELLSAHPELRRYLSLGSEMTVLWKGTAYKITGR